MLFVIPLRLASPLAERSERVSLMQATGDNSRLQLDTSRIPLHWSFSARVELGGRELTRRPPAQPGRTLYGYWVILDCKLMHTITG